MIGGIVQGECNGNLNKLAEYIEIAWEKQTMQKNNINNKWILCSYGILNLLWLMRIGKGR